MPDESPAAEATEEKPATTNHVDGKTMHVKIHAPFKVYFDGEAESISAVNPTGPFDILAKHHNFMTLLSTGDIIVRTGNGEEKIPITRGIMHVKQDEIIVFLDV
jgi:F0F1-type ATP synthase epsilon subunit